MKNKECAICEDLIPNYSRDRLIEMGYNGVYDNLKKKHYIFCPKHTSEIIAEFMEKNEIGVIFGKNATQTPNTND